jgi:DNA polymerase-1
MLIFDLEADGYLNEATKIHCLVIKDTVSNTRYVCNDQPDNPDWMDLKTGLELLEQADHVCGHNVLKYDLPLIKKLYPWFGFKGKVTDTLIVGRLLFPDLSESDDRLIKMARLNPKYRNRHSLEAWGHRLQCLKGEFKGPWDVWTQEMQDYCVQDVVVTEKLLGVFQRKQGGWPAEAVELEHDVARIISRQEQRGFAFDEPLALELLKTLSIKRHELEEQLKAQFGCWYAPEKKEPLVPKADNKKLGYIKDAALSKVKRVEFNPGSRQHIAKMLTERFGWKPDSYTSTGIPEVSEESLKAIRHPEAATLLDYLTVTKRLGQLAEGKEAWLKYIRNGRIHGSVNTLGTVTGRMSHSNPNIAQVPAGRSPYGHECRSLFKASDGMVLVGCDAAALELRVLAHYMARYDGGQYGRAAVEGTKEEGTDVHTLNMRALGISSRDDAKTWFYAFLYGAGDEKLGSIISKVKQPGKNKKLGKKYRAAFMGNLPAMNKLIGQIKAKAETSKSLKGIDGRTLFVRSAHSAANTLFQSTGAVLMKKALVLLDRSLQHDHGLVPGIDYEFVANVHDEFQIECRPEVAEVVGRSAVQAIRDAGSAFQLRCPLDGEFVVGRTWNDTH